MGSWNTSSWSLFCLSLLRLSPHKLKLSIPLLTSFKFWFFYKVLHANFLYRALKENILKFRTKKTIEPKARRGRHVVDCRLFCTVRDCQRKKKKLKSKEEREKEKERYTALGKGTEAYAPKKQIAVLRSRCL